MSGFNARLLTVDFETTTLVGIRTRGFTINAEPVDITNDDDSGWRTLLAEPGLRSMEVPVAGISSDEILIAAIMEGTTYALSAVLINLASGVGEVTPGTLAGDFFLSSLEQTGEHDGAVEFTATLMSSGAITYTATAGA